jgi:hypothetical protein
MSLRASSWLAWSLAGLSLVLCGAGIALYLATLPVQPPSSWGTGGLSAVLYAYLPFLAFPLVGALIASRRPENPIGWLCLAVGLSWMLAIASGAYAVYGLRVASPGSLPFPAAIGSLGESLAPATAGLIGTYMILLFPDGRAPSRRWRPLAWLSGAVIVLMSVGSVLTPGRLEDLGRVRNPFGLEQHPWVGEAAQTIILLLPLCILASVASLVLRFLRSGGEERAQIKWLAFAASILTLGFSSFVILGFFIAEGPTAGADPLWENLLENAMTMSFAGVPVAVGIAVLRYRLYDIDLLINRALVYGPLTVLLALVYAGGVVSLQFVVRTLTGQESTLAVVASTLAIAALAGPLRQRVQALVDRRFYRGKYDAAKTLEAFSAKLRDETDLYALTREVVGVARETMQPAHASLWLRPNTASKDDEVPG